MAMHWNALMFMVLLTEEISTNRSNCSHGQIYINDLLRPGCYPTTRLEEPCDFDVQCNAAVPYTFCSWDSDDLSLPKCQCIDGFASTQDGQCHPIDTCDLKEYNAGLLQADCKENQFCRNGYCFCKPGFAYDAQIEECVLVEPNESLNQLMSTSQLNDNFENADYKKTVSELVKLKESLKTTQYVIAAMLAAIVLTATIGTCFLILRKDHIKTRHSMNRNNAIEIELHKPKPVTEESIPMNSTDWPPPYENL